MMKNEIVVDIFGNTLKVGDIVAVNPPYYKGLTMGKIVKFCPKKIAIMYFTYGGMFKRTTAFYPCDVVKMMAVCDMVKK